MAVKAYNDQLRQLLTNVKCILVFGCRFLRLNERWVQVCGADICCAKANFIMHDMEIDSLVQMVKYGIFDYFIK